MHGPGHPFSYTLEGRATKRNIEQDRAGQGSVSIEIGRSMLRQRNGLAVAIVQVLLCGYGPHLSEGGTVDEIGRPHPTISHRIYSEIRAHCDDSGQRGLRSVVVTLQILVPVHVRWVLYLKRGHERRPLGGVG